MPLPKLRGVFPALVTPFRDGSLDEAAFVRLVERQVAAGVHGLVPVGTTGESATLSHEEHRRVIEICVDVPDLARGVQFYANALGFSVVSEPYPGVAALAVGAAKITLLEKREGTKPSSHARDLRRYDRHWTPVHLDFHVDDLKVALDKAVSAGAIKEQFFEDPDHGSAAFCADPFGNGFCLLERRSA